MGLSKNNTFRYFKPISVNLFRFLINDGQFICLFATIAANKFNLCFFQENIDYCLDKLPLKRYNMLE
jgi:hypothetical protein